MPRTQYFFKFQSQAEEKKLEMYLLFFADHTLNAHCTPEKECKAFNVKKTSTMTFFEMTIIHMLQIRKCLVS